MGVSTPFLTRSTLGLVLFICSAAVLGTSAVIQNDGGIIGYHEPIWAYISFVGTFTIISEVGLMILRWKRPEWRIVTLAGEASVAAVVTGLWIAAAICSSPYAFPGRPVCSDIERYVRAVQGGNASEPIRSNVRAILNMICNKLSIQLGFLWAGAIILASISSITTVLGFRRSNGTAQSRNWLSSFKTSGRTKGGNPFADPVGIEA